MFNIFGNFSTQVIVARIIVLMTAIPVHEFAHAFAADKMGDPTARYRKRLSLNPLDHIDPIGALMILLFGFGFARPVPINSLNFKDHKKGIIVTSLAGPFSNILLALACLIVTKLLFNVYLTTGIAALYGIVSVISYMVSINISLAVFNLLPIPPLDGYHAACYLLPMELRWKIQGFEHQMIWVVLLLVWLGVLTPIISFLSSWIYTLLNALTFFL